MVKPPAGHFVTTKKIWMITRNPKIDLGWKKKKTTRRLGFIDKPPAGHFVTTKKIWKITRNPKIDRSHVEIQS